MRISEAKTLLSEIVKFNLEEYERQMTTGRVDTNSFMVPIFLGDPGLGKTAINKQVAKDFGLPYFQTIIAQHDAGVMAGLPFIRDQVIEHFDEDGNVTEKETRSRMVQVRPSYLPDIDDPSQRIGIWNLDELPQAYLANLNICSQIVNEWRVGDHEISRGITITCTGKKLHNFNPGTDVNNTPRSWEKASNILDLDLPQAIRYAALAGTIGSGEVTEFEAYLRVEKDMPDPDFIIANPESAPVFGTEKADILYLLMASLADKASKKNIGNVLKYLNRMPNKEFIAYWSQEATGRDRTLLETKEMTEWKMKEGAKIRVG
jgi:hypothetical protein